MKYASLAILVMKLWACAPEREARHELFDSGQLQSDTNMRVDAQTDVWSDAAKDASEKADAPSPDAAPLHDAAPVQRDYHPFIAFTRYNPRFEYNLDIFGVEPATGEIINLTNRRGDEYDGAWSPDKSGLVFRFKEFASEGIRTLDLRTNQTRVIKSGFGGQNPAWSPNGKKVAYSGINIIDLETGQDTRLVEGSKPAWHPNGRTMAYHTDETGDIYVVDVATKEKQLLTQGGYPTYSPDGNWLAFQRDTNIMVRDMQSGEETQLTRRQRAQEPTWSPEGKELAYIAGSGGNESLHILPVFDDAGQFLTGQESRKVADRATEPAWR